jgi:hypothetical protein
MDIESIDPTKIKTIPFINVELAEVGDGYYITNVIWKTSHADAESVISACINIFNTFINSAPEEKQIELEEYLMNGLIKGMENRFEHTRTVDTSS